MYFLFKIAAIAWAIAAGADSPVNTSIFWLLFLIGTAFAFWACWAQAIGKGHSGSFALFALFGFWGFIVVAILSDRARDGSITTASASPAT
ncbi:MAG TPA: hypothetical protein VN380_24780 [Thermoanaerobaculia bacterium]|nr:hypothetical protein [Thermoanaerobaculia bacterium]